MAYKAPTSRKAKRNETQLNLIPILDAVFIFIFFLLMSTQFIKIFEIESDIPIISNQSPPKSKKKPLALTLLIKKSSLTVQTGVPAKTVKTIRKNPQGKFRLNDLHEFLVQLKKRNKNENTIILEPLFDLKYEEIIEIMDAVRTLESTDDAIFIKDKDKLDVRVKSLFSNIIFGNLMS